MPKTNPCSNCGDDVPARRRSTTGDHWCSKPGCLAARQKAYRARVRAARHGEAQSVDDARFAFFVAAMGPRRSCDVCQLEDAVPGFVHRDLAGEPCFGVGSAGAGIGVRWIDAVHPERSAS